MDTVPFDFTHYFFYKASQKLHAVLQYFFLLKRGRVGLQTVH